MADIQNVTISDQPVRVTIGAVGPQGPGGGGSTTIDLSMHDLEELRNVSGTPQDDNILLYDSTANTWRPGQFGAGLTVTGSTVSLTNPNAGGGGGTIQDYIQSVRSTSANNLLTLSFTSVVGGTVQSEPTEAIIPLDSIRSLSFNTTSRQIMVETVDARTGMTTTVPLANMPALPSYIDIGDPATAAGDYALRRNMDGTFAWALIDSSDMRTNLQVWDMAIGYMEGDIVRYRPAATVPFGTYQRITGTETTVTNPEASLVWQRIDGVYLQHNGVAASSLDPTEGPLPALTARFDKINFTGDGIESVRYDNVNDCWIVNIAGGGTGPTPPTMLMTTDTELLGGPNSNTMIENGRLPVNFAAQQFSVRYTLPMGTISSIMTAPTASFNGDVLPDPTQTPTTFDATSNSVTYTWSLTPAQAATIGATITFSPISIVVDLADGSTGTATDDGAPDFVITDTRALTLSSPANVNLFSTADLTYSFPTRTNVDFGTGVTTSVLIGPDANNLTALTTQPTVTNSGFTIPNADLPVDTPGNFTVRIVVTDTRAATDRVFTLTDTVRVNDNRVARLTNTGDVSRSILMGEAAYTNVVQLTNVSFTTGVTATLTITGPSTNTSMTITDANISLPANTFAMDGEYTVSLSVVDTRAATDRTFMSSQTVTAFSPFFAYALDQTDVYSDFPGRVQRDTMAAPDSVSTEAYPPDGVATVTTPMGAATRVILFELREDLVSRSAWTGMLGVVNIGGPFANTASAQPTFIDRMDVAGNSIRYSRYILIEMLTAGSSATIMYSLS